MSSSSIHQLLTVVWQ